MTDQAAHSSDTPVLILDADAIRRALRRIAHEIIEQNSNLADLLLIGIPSRGVEVSLRLATLIEEIEGIRPPTGTIDVSMHRDDLGLRSIPPAVKASHLPDDINKSSIVLVDDVFYTGRTIRAAMDSLASFGRPSRIQLAVLVDRGHRELPIRPDYVGKNLPTSRSERVMVRLQGPDDQPDSVTLKKGNPSQ